MVELGWRNQVYCKNVFSRECLWGGFPSPRTVLHLITSRREPFDTFPFRSREPRLHDKGHSFQIAEHRRWSSGSMI